MIHIISILKRQLLSLHYIKVNLGRGPEEPINPSVIA